MNCRLLPLFGAWIALGLAAAGCTPTVKVEPPDEPITINLNVKIEHEIKVQVDKDLEKAFEANDDIF